NNSDDEKGLPNVEVTATVTYDNGATVTITTKTDSDGKYSFGNLLLDEDYAASATGGGTEPRILITVTSPTGMISTHTSATDLAEADNQADDPTNEPAEVVQGGSDFTNDFGYRYNGSIGDTVYLDDGAGAGGVANDGLQNGTEAGIADVTVTLTEAGPDGTHGTADDVTVGTKTTDSSGKYSFTGLAAGKYRVNVDESDADLGGKSLTSSNDPQDITLAAGATDDTADFGFNTTGVIGDRVWLDENGDGVQDAGEAGISGVTVYIDTDNNGGYTAGDIQAVTDSNGNYLLKGVAPGTHTVLVKSDTLPAGLAANPTDDEDGASTPHQIVTTHPLSAGENYLTADFGYNWVSPVDTDNPSAGATGAIGDRIWNDADGDGVQDAGEVGIVGVTVKLLTDDDGDGVYDVEFKTTTTGPDGRYIFDTLPPGSYVVAVDTASLNTAGYNTTPTGDPDSILDGKTSSPVVLAPGDVFVNADFGYKADGDNNPATLDNGGHSIGDLIYLDTNASGAYDSAVDTGIPGVSVVLEDSSGNILATAITDETGVYRFDGLPDGAYTVKVADNGNLLDGLSATGFPAGGSAYESSVT
ncbi:MAG: SdrD B-like domain-containing protein, partial [Candidatus Electrothrix sp.]